MFDCPEVAAEHKERSCLGRNPLGCSMARYYNPSIGRFISEDPIPSKSRSLAELNAYPYARNSPLKFTDPTGRKCKDVDACLKCLRDKGQPPVSGPAAEILKNNLWKCDSNSDDCFEIDEKGNVQKCVGHAEFRFIIITDIDPPAGTTVNLTACQIVAHEIAHAFSHIEDDDVSDEWAKHFTPECCNGVGGGK